MQLPAVKDATVRSLLLVAVGVLLLTVLPDGALGEAPLWSVPGQSGPTPANLVGIALILAGWVYFLVVVVLLRALRRGDLACRICLGIGAVALAVAVVALTQGFRTVGLVALLLAALSNLLVAARLWRPASAIVRSEAEVSAGLP